MRVSSETVPDEDNGARDGEAKSQLRKPKWEVPIQDLLLKE
jgi:hypothetical protein